MFKRVRLNVRQRSQGRQIPWESTSLEEDFFFNDGSKFSLKPEDLERQAIEARQKGQQLQRQADQAREREKQLALALEQERQAQAQAARLTEEKRLQAEREAREAERLAGEAKLKEQQRLAQEAKQLEAQRLAQEAQAKARERQLAEQQAKEQAQQKALALAREAEARKQEELEQIAADAKARDVAKQLSKEQQRDQAFAAEKSAWDKIKDSKNANDYYEFLKQFPIGTHAEIAEFQLNKIARPAIQVTPAKDQAPSLSYTQERFRVGDVFVFEVKDSLTGVVQGKSRSEVTAIQDGIVVINRGGMRLDMLGGMTSLRSSGQVVQYEPAWNPGPAEFQVGRKWSGFSKYKWTDGINYNALYSGKVAAIETITVPAGTFQTYRVEMNVNYQNGSFDEWTYWFDPRYGIPIKRKQIGRGGTGIYRTDLRELLSLQADRS